MFRISDERQEEEVFELLKSNFPTTKADLATAFIERSLLFCSKKGTIAVVTPQIWLFLGPYKQLKANLLKNYAWNFVARFGPGAFETISGEVVNVGLFVITQLLRKARIVYRN